jgi:hypothetical protein
VFEGELMARIGTPDTERTDYMVMLSLRLRGDVLNGDVTAAGIGGSRARNALSHWLEVKRQ